MSDPNDDPAAAADDPVVELKQSDLNRMMAAARRQGKGEKPEKPAPAPAPSTVAEIVAATIGALHAQQQPPVEPPRPAAAAPSAPNGRVPSSYDPASGLTNPFGPGVAEDLGPRGVRKALEDLWGLAADRSGAPSRPKPPR